MQGAPYYLAKYTATVVLVVVVVVDMTNVLTVVMRIYVFRTPFPPRLGGSDGRAFLT